MAVMPSCHDRKNTPVLQEIICPQCHETMEIFTRDGRIVQDCTCERCGHIIPEGEHIET